MEVIILFIFKELLVFSCRIKKKNEFHITQSRNLVLSSAALYNFKDKSNIFSIIAFRRRIPLEKISCITMSLKSDKFIVHVDQEHDYLLSSPQ